MKILYAIQGTGNGHLSRALDLVPELYKRAQVELLVSGSQSEIQLPFPIKYKLAGLSFIFGKKGGIDYKETWKRNSLARLFKEIKHLPVKDYDLVISDFEPVSAWSSLIKSVPCYSLSHQAALLSKHSPRPFIADPIGSAILKFYAPSPHKHGFHFQPYDKNIWCPRIRPEVKNLNPTNKGYYVVYLPAYGEEQTIEVLNQIPHKFWYVFSKHSHRIYQSGNVFVRPVDSELFIQAMADCEGVLSGAGFETPAEALYLGKKLMVVPMKGQYEQKLNALALKDLGVPVIPALSSNHVDAIWNWVDHGKVIHHDFTGESQDLVDNLLVDFIENFK
jgi:uncharacterized protein (TIGR00661 family)